MFCANLTFWYLSKSTILYNVITISMYKISKFLANSFLIWQVWELEVKFAHGMLIATDAAYTAKSEFW